MSACAGDTNKSAEIANKAMIDMADNANKMGTDMGSIQNAYQGFAKQNYTMLDTLSWVMVVLRRRWIGSLRMHRLSLVLSTI